MIDTYVHMHVQVSLLSVVGLHVRLWILVRVDADMQMASAAYRCVPRLPTRICLVRALIPRGTYVSELEIDEQPNRDLVNLDARTVSLPPRPDNRYCKSHCFAVKLDQSHDHAKRRGTSLSCRRIVD